MGSTNGRRRRWGRVWAQPSEYLIQLRGGRVVRHGPGLSVFLWPSDSAAVLPTSIRRLCFTADQVTAEKVGVAVTGVAVYRIAEPLLAFRMLPSADGDTPLEQLELILKDMFVGAVRRLVAATTVEACLRQRKEAIAEELLREIRPVVSGRGRTDDSTTQGWGVVLDTIEIQDVRILSEQVFADLQAPFRAELELRARTARVARDREVHLREGEAEQVRLEADVELHRRRAATEFERLQREHEAARWTAAQQAELERFQTEARLARAALEAETESTLHARRLEQQRLDGELRQAQARQARELENLLPEQRIRYEFVTKALPAIARAFAESMGPIHVTQISGGGDGRGPSPLADTFAQLLAVARSAGLDLSGLWHASETGDEPGPAKPPAHRPPRSPAD
jgi:regulator of protease activity HflC (stomatin/prohibitin superfamily)